MYKILFYIDANDNGVIDVFLEELEKEAERSKNGRIQLKKVLQYFDILRVKGTRAGEPFVKSLGSGFWELRPLDNRLIFACWHSNKLLILHHFKKKTNKTPHAEINIAKKRYNEWISRKGGK